MVGAVGMIGVVGKVLPLMRQEICMGNVRRRS